MNQYPIPMSDFSSIYRVIYSILSNERANIVNACWYFNIIGSLILQKQYKLNAMPVGGLAVFKLAEAAPSLFLGKVNERNEYVSTEQNFHFWIELDDWLIDFTSPHYPDILKAAGSSIYIPSKMFQRKKSEICKTPNDVKNVGDFYLEENLTVTNYYNAKFNGHLMNQDLAKIANTWYQRPPGGTRSSWKISNQKNEVIKVKLNYMSIKDAW